MADISDQLKAKEEEKRKKGSSSFYKSKKKKKRINLLSFEARFSSDPTDPFLFSWK